MIKLLLLSVLTVVSMTAHAQATIEFDIPDIQQWVKVNDGVNLRQGPSVSSAKLVWKTYQDEFESVRSPEFSTAPKKGETSVRVKYAPIMGEQNDWLNIYFFEQEYSDTWYSKSAWVLKKLTQPIQIAQGVISPVDYDENSYHFHNGDFEHIKYFATGKFRGLWLLTSYGYFDAQYLHLGCEVDGMLVLFAWIPASWSNDDLQKSVLHDWGPENNPWSIELSSAIKSFYLDQCDDLEQTVDLLISHPKALTKEKLILVPFKGEKEFKSFVFDDEYTGPVKKVKFETGIGYSSTETISNWADRELAKLKTLCDDVDDAYKSGNIGTYLRDYYTIIVGICAALETRKADLTAAQQSKLSQLKPKVIKGIGGEENLQQNVNRIKGR